MSLERNDPLHRSRYVKMGDDDAHVHDLSTLAKLQAVFKSLAGGKKFRGRAAKARALQNPRRAIT